MIREPRPEDYGAQESRGGLYYWDTPEEEEHFRKAYDAYWALASDPPKRER
jgi:hypothetical protein